MEISTGAEDTFIVSSATGRVVCTFEERGLADDWIADREGNGVAYRLFLRRSDVVELEHTPGQPNARGLSSTA